MYTHFSFLISILSKNNIIENKNSLYNKPKEKNTQEKKKQRKKYYTVLKFNFFWHNDFSDKHVSPVIRFTFNLNYKIIVMYLLCIDYIE